MIILYKGNIIKAPPGSDLKNDGTTGSPGFPSGKNKDGFRELGKEEDIKTRDIAELVVQNMACSEGGYPIRLAAPWMELIQGAALFFLLLFEGIEQNGIFNGNGGLVGEKVQQ